MSNGPFRSRFEAVPAVVRGMLAGMGLAVSVVILLQQFAVTQVGLATFIVALTGSGLVMGAVVRLLARGAQGGAR